MNEWIWNHRVHTRISYGNLNFHWKFTNSKREWHRTKSKNHWIWADSFLFSLRKHEQISRNVYFLDVHGWLPTNWYKLFGCLGWFGVYHFDWQNVIDSESCKFHELFIRPAIACVYVCVRLPFPLQSDDYFEHVGKYASYRHHKTNSIIR